MSSTIQSVAESNVLNADVSCFINSKWSYQRYDNSKFIVFAFKSLKSEKCVLKFFSSLVSLLSFISKSIIAKYFFIVLFGFYKYLHIRVLVLFNTIFKYIFSYGKSCVYNKKWFSRAFHALF